MQQPSKAISAYQRALDIDPTNAVSKTFVGKMNIFINFVNISFKEVVTELYL